MPLRIASMRLNGELDNWKALFELFSAATVDAFDLDPKMIELAGKRLESRGDRVSLWVGDATHIEAPESTYDTVFDFGIIHHIPDWRKAVRRGVPRIGARRPILCGRSAAGFHFPSCLEKTA